MGKSQAQCLGFGRSWDAFTGVGNPASAASVKEYLKSVQRKSHFSYLTIGLLLHLFSRSRGVKEFLQEKNMFCLGASRGLSYSFLRVIEEDN